MVRAAAWVLVVALAPVLGACGAGRASPTPVTTTTAPARPARPALPALCRATRAARVGLVTDPRATELSGLAAGSRPGLLWSHNDSGDAPRLFALRTDGTVLGTPAVTGAQAVDWEDIAAAPGEGGGRLLYVGDIGDNTAARASVDVYRVPEPAPDAAATAPLARLRLRYPDGAHDAEALLVDPAGDRLVIVTKGLDGGRAYATGATRPAGSTATLRRGPRVSLALVTGGDVSADGRIVVLRTYASLHLWVRRGREPLLRTLARPQTCTVPAALPEQQGEAVALTASGSVAYTTSEGSPAPILRVGRRRR